MHKLFRLISPVVLLLLAGQVAAHREGRLAGAVERRTPRAGARTLL